MDLNNDITDRDERRVAELVGGLRRVEAPGDLATRVRARIALADKGERRGWSPFQIARIAVPAMLLIAIGGYFGFYALRPPEVNTPTQAAATGAPAVNDTTMSDVTLAAAPSPISPRAANNVAQALPAPDRKPADPAVKNSDQGGGSVDEASRGSTTVFPRGFDPNAAIAITRVFEMIGVTAKWDGSGWHVETVTAGTVGERSGLKTGDVIVAVNGRPVDERSVFAGSFTSRSLTVRRGGKRIELAFRP
jgi:membrane-associated protease RseP (regulator of RpoE activity)